MLVGIMPSGLGTSNMKGGHFFSNRVVRDYNALPNYVKQAANINIFKNCLDKHRGTPSRTTAGPQRT